MVDHIISQIVCFAKKFLAKFEVIPSPPQAQRAAAQQLQFCPSGFPPGTVVTTPSGARTPHLVPDFGSSPGARTKNHHLLLQFTCFVVYMFCSLDTFRNILEYAISCSETILSQYVRIVDTCQELGYLVFLAPNVVSQCSNFSYSATDKNSTKFLLDFLYTIVYSMQKVRFQKQLLGRHNSAIV